MTHRSSISRALIVGAGTGGRELVRLLRREAPHVTVVGFLDDRYTPGLRSAGVSVLGPISTLDDVVKKRRIDRVYIAIPSAEGRLIRRIVNSCKHAKVSFQIIPRLLELVEGHVKIDQVRNIEPQDLLGRAIIKSDQRQLRKLFAHRVVVVTGAAGSIGSELTRQLAEYGPAHLIALDWWENGLYDFEYDLRRSLPKLKLTTHIVNVQDADKIGRMFRTYRPDFVFHAAAYKHVPLMERHPEEALRNNILGTWNVAKATKQVGAKKFILISTDKAVHPTSVMGATKAVSELLIQSLHGGKTHFSCVRFGNVIASRGSVIPLFQKQIAHGGPVTLTHPDMIRYFMSIPEAVQLILHAAQLTSGGEIFVLDMGEPVKIIDLAENLIRLSGFRPNVDIPIIFTGIRPGEKLFEEIMTDQEGIHSTKKANILIADKPDIGTMKPPMILKETVRLARLANANKIRTFLRHVLPDYRPTKGT